MKNGKEEIKPRYGIANPYESKVVDRKVIFEISFKMTEERIISMKKRLVVLFFCFELLMAVFSGPQRARATLGESVDSIGSDRRIVSTEKVTSKVISTAYANYTVYQLKYDGTSVREYVSASGIVFGIAWNGLIHPDLTPLLGSYASEYQEALERTVRNYGERHLQVKAARVIVQKWGHMRNLQGRAYAPDLIPAGVTVDEIR